MERATTKRLLLPAAGALVFATALAAWLWSLRAWPYAQLRQADLEVYWLAATSLRHGDGRLYTMAFGPLKLPYIYPPFAALLFRPTVPLGLGAVRVGMLALSVLTLPVVVAASLRLLGHRLRLGAVLLLSGLALWSAPVQWTLMWGQVNLLLLALVMVDLALPAHSRWKGVGIGLATGIKLSPGLFLVLLLLTRQRRAALTGAAVTGATMVLPWLLLPRSSGYYWLHLGRITTAVDRRVGLYISNNQSLRGALVRALGDHGTAATLAAGLSVLLVAVALPLAAVVALRGGRSGPLAAACACGALTLLVSPVAWIHHWVWVIPALVLLADGMRRHAPRPLLPAAAAWALLYGAWPLLDRITDHSRPMRQPYGVVFLAPHLHRGEYHWTVTQSLIGDSLLLSGLAFCLGVAGYGARLLLAERAQLTPAASGTAPAARAASRT
ncbi:alpha-1,2-mannosyltransferase [Streptacidiphilus sp. MAP12-20]|uniref:glycosyltransferase 87 family protein n=1 Tax=Streptacidiphilus sp. MAP12-20 TaxID=3156299 RepID=UPI003516C560